MKKQIKLAIIRGDDGANCPFGLAPISHVCKNAGKSVLEMTVIDSEDKDKIIKENQDIYNKLQENERCIYATKIFNNDVICDFGDTAAGLGTSPIFNGSSYYTGFFNGTNLDGLFSYPFPIPSDLYGDTVKPDKYYNMYDWASKINKIEKRAKFWKNIKR